MSAMSQGEGLPRALLTCWITAVAPLTKVPRKASSPARVMTPSRCLPAVEWSFGVKPSQAAKSRAVRKARGSGTFIASSAARADRGTLCQPPAQFVLPVPSQQLRVDPAKLRLEFAVLFGERGKQLFGEFRHVGGGRDPRHHGLDF